MRRSRTGQSVGQICGKAALIKQNDKVAQNSQVLVEFSGTETFSHIRLILSFRNSGFKRTNLIVRSHSAAI